MIRVRFILKKGDARAEVLYRGEDAYAGADAFTFQGDESILSHFSPQFRRRLWNLEDLLDKLHRHRWDGLFDWNMELIEPAEGPIILDNGAHLYDSKSEVAQRAL